MAKCKFKGDEVEEGTKVFRCLKPKDEKCEEKKQVHFGADKFHVEGRKDTRKVMKALEHEG